MEELYCACSSLLRKREQGMHEKDSLLCDSFNGLKNIISPLLISHVQLHRASFLNFGFLLFKVEKDLHQLGTGFARPFWSTLENSCLGSFGPWFLLGHGCVN